MPPHIVDGRVVAPPDIETALGTVAEACLLGAGWPPPGSAACSFPRSS